MFQLSLRVALGLFSAPAFADSEPMTITSSSGKSMTGRLRSLVDGKVTVVRDSDKKVFDMALDSLDEKSRAAVKEWDEKGGNISTRFDVQVDPGRTRKTTGAEDFDDQRVTLNPTITIKNPDVHRKAIGGKVTAIFLGKPVENASNIFVFKTQTFDLPSLEPIGSTEFKVAKISQAYDRRGYGKFGARYIGYALVIHNADGSEIYHAQSIPSNFANGNKQQLLSLKTEKLYNKNLEPLE